MNPHPQQMIHIATFLASCCHQASYLEKPEFTVPKGFGYTLETMLAVPPEFTSERIGYMMHNTDNMVIAFKGHSGTTFDYGTHNNLFFLEPYPFVKDSGQTQVGFNFAYKLVRQKMISTLLSLLKNSPHKKVYLTGYDIGAGIATVAALDLMVNLARTNLEVITFGSPRVGDPEFTRKYNSVIPNSRNSRWCGR